MSKKICIIAALLAAIFLLPFFGAVAYAATEDELPDIGAAPIEPALEYPVDMEEAPPVMEYTVEVERPFTPSGTGTVVDNATDGDGKEFYTIITPDENVFYLVIDRQRGQDNVYFLNAVTEADLLSLAKITEYPITQPMVEQLPPPVDPEPAPTSEPEQNSSNTGTLIIIIVIVLIGGGAGWYFKIYRPKQQQADSEEDYTVDESDLYGEGEQDAWPDDDDVPWYDEEEDNDE
jgi:hypothetical protein